MSTSNPIFHPSHAPTPKPILTIHALTPNPNPKTTFPLFPTLPPELRLRIFRFCLPGPRIIWSNLKCTCEPCSAYHPVTFFNTTHPTLLSVNRESRIETLRHYAIIYSVRLRASLAFDNQKDVCFPYGHTCCDLSPSLFSSSRELFTIPPHAIKRDVRIRRMAVHESMLGQGNAADWVQLDELLIVVRPNRNLVWPHSIYCERERTLEPGVLVKQENGWGDAVGLNGLMRELEGLCKNGDEARNREGRKMRMPVVKVVQPRAVEDRDDPFCVRITPLSLRK